MKVADLLEARRKNWQELERLTEQMQFSRKKLVGSAGLSRFTTLYRAACADLALADAYQLPPNTIQYLHRLVGRAHNQLYRSRRFEFGKWFRVLTFDVPQEMFRDNCLRVAALVFFGSFVLAAVLAYNRSLYPGFAEAVMTAEQIDAMEASFSSADLDGGGPGAMAPTGSGFYAWWNTGIGLQCFAGGFLIVPGLIVTLFNGGFLGAAFGHMATTDAKTAGNFFNFVTAHGPFELTAIALSAGSGLKLGIGWLFTKGMTRGASLQRAGREAMPMMGTAMVLFFLAAMIEGMLSPTSVPYFVKAGVAVLSSLTLMTYFVVLGFPRRPPRAA
jgi:uncharacterized membrane protein SpoIIM required for sporulation